MYLRKSINGKNYSIWLGLSDRKNFTKNYLNPAIEAGFVALSNPDSPTSSEQRYILTTLGKRIANQ
ncbi:Fic family protein [Olivibacter sp. CPCC 100613]|uniref:Fic family protein n=1 Tax=Olivibacter sp. CPCC 100613 TaxID=3079931 RepID=UPI003FA5F6AB